ncbi:MAG: c-type cytochrome, partial [Halieaceae bacterium]
MAQRVSMGTMYLVGLLLANSVAFAERGSADTVAIGYTENQAVAGKSLYAKECANCHGLALRGGESAPGLAGRSFLEAWRTRTLGEFVAVNLTMPLSNPGGLA